MAVFVDAVEYRGDDLPSIVGGARVPTVHHAFDSTTGLLAHGPGTIRIGFAEPPRSWTSVPEGAQSCSGCQVAVTRTVSALIGRQLRVVSVALDDAHAVWLYPSSCDRTRPHHDLGET